MSLMIKGMDMPKRGCDHCFLRAGNYCSRLAENESVIKYAVKEERHPNCPLFELQKHGRLIDADVLMEKGMPLSFSVQKWVQEVDIVCAPTVIEAEN